MHLNRDEVEAALESKGFRRKDESDHRKFHFWTTDNKKTAIWTKTSRGTKYKVLGDELVSRMAKQTKLTNQCFGAFVSCEISQHDYEQTLVNQGLL